MTGWGEIVGLVVGAVLVIIGLVAHDVEVKRIGIGFLVAGGAFHSFNHAGVFGVRRGPEV